GAVHTEYTYEPFGGTTVTGSTTNPFQYTNRENDQTGLYYYRARYYDSRLGRFISEDPIGFAGSFNFYTYVQNNPIRFVDPRGLCQSDSFAVNTANSTVQGIYDFRSSVAAPGDQETFGQYIDRLQAGDPLFNMQFEVNGVVSGGERFNINLPLDLQDPSV